MTLKHNFSTLYNSNDPLTGWFAEVSIASNTGLSIGLLIFIFVVAVYVTIRKTQDTTKAMVIGGHSVFIFGLLLYYAGKIFGQVFIHDFIFYGISVIYGLGLVYSLFIRMKTDD